MQFADSAVAPRSLQRPPLALRVLIGLVALVAAIFNVAILVSDRAPGFLRRVFGDFARRLSDRLDSNARVEVIRDGGLPESDAIVHIGMWAVATLLIALTIWTWRGLLLASIAAFAASVGLELAQGLLTTTRDVESRDMLANAVGVLVGAAAAVVCFGLWSVVSGVVRGSRRRRR